MVSYILALCALNRFDELPDKLELLEHLLQLDTSLGSQLTGYGALAAGYDCLGQRNKAIAAADKLPEGALSGPPASFAVRSGFEYPLTTYLNAWEHGDKSRLVRLRKVLKAMGSYAKVFSVGEATYQRLLGRFEWLSVNHTAAFAAWNKAIAAAETMDMPYELAQAHYELGRHLPAADPARKMHLAKAQGLYEQIGAMNQVEQIKKALG